MLFVFIYKCIVIQIKLRGPVHIDCWHDEVGQTLCLCGHEMVVIQVIWNNVIPRCLADPVYFFSTLTVKPHSICVYTYI